MLELIKCAECGRLCERNSPSQKFCKYCAKIRRRKMENNRNKRIREEQKVEKINAAQLNNTPVTVGKSSSRIIAEARAFGMTYGTYTAAIRDGSIEQILKAKGFDDPEAVLRELSIK